MLPCCRHAADALAPGPREPCGRKVKLFLGAFGTLALLAAGGLGTGLGSDEPHVTAGSGGAREPSKFVNGLGMNAIFRCRKSVWL